MSGPRIPRLSSQPGGGWWSRSNVAANDPATAGLAPEEPFVDSEVPAELLVQCEQCGAETGTLEVETPNLMTLLTGAVRVGESIGTQRAYEDGYRDGMRGQWWWGVVCGGCSMGLLALICIAAGRANGWWV